MWVPKYFCLLILGLAGMRATAAPPYPPPGKLVDAGGYRVHLYCVGEGKPTVVVTGMEFSFIWSMVQAEAAKLIRVCTYDPSGTAWSDPGPTLTCRARVKELHTVLRNARIEGPYVLVGWSMGAIVARLYASEYPTESAGMVMVDHAFLDVGASTAVENARPAATGDSPPVLVHKEPIDWTIEDDPNFAKLPVRNRELYHWAMALHPVLPTAEAAEECLSAVNAAAHGRGDPLGDMPLVVISTVPHPPAYEKLQQELLSLSRNSKRLIAEKSFHAVTIDQPEVVVRAIREVVEAVRR
jgi:pimeloyl-ACP methyl ester carboxylesterase